MSVILLSGLLAGPAFGLNITSITPATYQSATLTTGAQIYVDAGGTVADIPLALNDGSLIRTQAADASNGGLAVSFNVDLRAEVYVCYDSRSAAPAWLNGWVNTGMTVGTNNAPVAQYNVYAKRFPAGTVALSNNAAAAMYFIVVKESEAILPRLGWVLLSYDMPYLREIIRQAPFYHVNHIQFSHDIMMYVYQPVESTLLRADLNELVDLAHAYGVTDVTVWTHEFGTHGLPNSFREGGMSTGRVDGDNPDTWDWTKNNYDQLLSTACPELDGVVVTFSENEGCDVWDAGCFKYTGTVADAIKKIIETVQASCHTYGKTCYARTWAGTNQWDVSNGIVLTGDKTTWMMSKNIGGGGGTDWWDMDSHLDCIGSVADDGYNEMIEFDLCGEYMGRGRYTFAMSSYLKDHYWNWAYTHGVRGGMVARIDRQGSISYYGANRLSLYALREVMANPNADPAAINLAWAQQNFPADMAQDIADSYDAPGSPWNDDTRYLTWEAFFPDVSPITSSQAQTIGTTAIAAIDRHRAQLETKHVLDTREGKSDYDTLRNGLIFPLLDVGGTLPIANGFSNFRPPVGNSVTPDCFIDVLMPSPGLHVTTVTCEYSVNGGVNWTSWPATATGANYSTTTQTISAYAVPFNQFSEVDNTIRFTAKDMSGVLYTSGILPVNIVNAPIWGTFKPGITRDLTPECTLTVTATSKPLDMTSAGYSYSVDGGNTWIMPQTGWQNRYECDQLPSAAGWTLVEGIFGYESVNAGILRINDTSTGSNTKVKYTKPWTVSPNVGATVLARMKCLSGGHFFSSNIQVSDEVHTESLYLKANGMLGLLGYNALMPVTTSTFHTYRVTIRNTDINVYLDENPKPIIRGNGAFVQALTNEQTLMIGSGASAGTQDIYYDYVYWTTAGAFAPGQWWEAGCSGNAQNGTLTAPAVAFNQGSNTLNKIRYHIKDTLGQTYESPVYTIQIITHGTWADFDIDGDVDMDDFGHLQRCFSGSLIPYGPGCADADVDADGDVDSHDYDQFLNCMAGANQTPACAK